MRQCFQVLFILTAYVSASYSDSVSDITKAIHLEKEGFVAGYGDFNSDRATDIFVISKQWKALHLYIWDMTKQFFQSPMLLLEIESGFKIVSTSFADFDGDGSMDIMVCAKTVHKTNGVTVTVYYGDRKEVKKGAFTAEMMDQPTIVDVNGDLLPDLFGVDTKTKTRSYWISVPGKKGSDPMFISRPQFSTGMESTLVIPNSNAFVDITGDLHPDLIIKSKTSEKKELIFETWVQNEGMSNLTLKNATVFNIKGVKHVGQMSFTDIDSDGEMDMILPVCLTKDCTRSAIYLNSFKGNAEWTLLVTNDNDDWQFPVDDMKDKSSNFPVTIRFGDLTMDGIMDAVMILQKKKSLDKFPAYLINHKCSRYKQSGCQGSRTFKVNKLQGVELPVVISLMDVNENGVLDFVISCEDKKEYDKYHTKVLRNDFNFDVAFLKVAVLTGTKPTASYGSNQIGAVVDISTINTDGLAMVGRATQLSQSSYFALQLPYVLFGLGRSPNFVDRITVGVPKGSQMVDRVKTWTAIIPNAQVIVIPYPKDKPYDWVTKLLVTPGKLLLQTGGVLIGTILLIGGIILILHIKEKKEDEREKRRDAHKFHFDAL